MTGEEIERCDALWRELFTAGKVRWMPGMLALDAPFYPCGFRVAVVGSDGGLENPPCYVTPLRTQTCSPVWTDPATLGCLLAMAREACGDDLLRPTHFGAFLPDSLRPWRVSGCGRYLCEGADTEAEAMLAAIAAVEIER